MSISFRKQVNEEFANSLSEISKAVTKAGKAAWRTAVENTPRDTGTAQAGWKLKIKKSSYVPVRRKHSSKPKTPNFRFSITKHKSFVLYNNVEYIEHLENEVNPRTNNIPPGRMLEKAKRKFTEVLFSELN